MRLLSEIESGARKPDAGVQWEDNFKDKDFKYLKVLAPSWLHEKDFSMQYDPPSDSSHATSRDKVLIANPSKWSSGYPNNYNISHFKFNNILMSTTNDEHNNVELTKLPHNSHHNHDNNNEQQQHSTSKSPSGQSTKNNSNAVNESDIYNSTNTVSHNSAVGESKNELSSSKKELKPVEPPKRRVIRKNPSNSNTST
jgi:hypothetical protein